MLVRVYLPANASPTFASRTAVPARSFGFPRAIPSNSTQALPIGYPLMSTYIELADMKKVAALQLVGQSNLIPSDYYLNFSGVRYTLKPAESNTYFKYATAAAILDLTSRISKVGVGRPLDWGLDRSICGNSREDSVGSAKINFNLGASVRRPAFLSPNGERLAAGDLKRWLRMARLIRTSLETNGGICRSLLQFRYDLAFDPTEVAR